MLEALNDIEKEIMFLLIRGQNFSGISQWLDISYSDYVKYKKSLLQKLGIRRVIQILPKVLECGLQNDDI